MKIRRLQRWIAEQLFGQSGRLALGATLAVTAFSNAASAQTTSTFQQGVNNYTSGVDTWIRAATASQSAATTINIDGGASTLGDASWSQALIRYDGIFGTGAGRIPVGSVITSATYTVHTTTGSNDQSGDNFDIYRLTTPFTSSTVFENFSDTDTGTIINSTPGVQGTEIVSPRDDRKGAGNVVDNFISFNVANSLTAWSGLANADAANAANLGWLITTAAGTNAWVFGSNDHGTVAYRPVLSVTYTAPAVGQNLTWTPQQPLALGTRTPAIRRG